LIRDNDTELLAATQILLQSTRRSQRVELLAVATGIVNPIASALAKVREPALVLPGQTRPATERSSSRRAARGANSEPFARLPMAQALRHRGQHTNPKINR
jgi:hypothetical protein